MQIKLTDRAIQQALIREIDPISGCSKFFPNVMFGEFERDLMRVMDSSHHWQEYEIKRSLSDFRADFKKSYDSRYFRHPKGERPAEQLKHEVMQRGAFTENPWDHWERQAPWKQPKHFWFVLPADVVEIDEVPEQYGVIRFGFGLRRGWPNRLGVRIERAAQILPNATKVDSVMKARLMSSIYYRYWRLNCGEGAQEGEGTDSPEGN